MAPSIEDVRADDAALAAVVDRWYGPTVRLVRLLARDGELGHEAARDAWIAVGRRLDELDGDDPLHLVALRATIESLAVRLAAAGPRPALPADTFETEGDRWAGWWRETTTPEDWPSRPEDEAIARALGDVDPASAAVVVLRDVEGLSGEEVERVLEVTPVDQRTLLHQGRVAVWKAIGPR